MLKKYSKNTLAVRLHFKTISEHIFLNFSKETSAIATAMLVTRNFSPRKVSNSMYVAWHMVKTQLLGYDGMVFWHNYKIHESKYQVHHRKHGCRNLLGLSIPWSAFPTMNFQIFILLNINIYIFFLPVSMFFSIISAWSIAA